MQVVNVFLVQGKHFKGLVSLLFYYLKFLFVSGNKGDKSNEICFKVNCNCIYFLWAPWIRFNAQRLLDYEILPIIKVHSMEAKPPNVLSGNCLR